MSEETPRKRARPHHTDGTGESPSARGSDALPPGCGRSAHVLSWLLGEQYPVSEFLRQFWEKKPLVVRRGDPGYYGDLFSRDKALRILRDAGAAADAHRDRGSAAQVKTDGKGDQPAASGEDGSQGFRHGQHLRVCQYAAEQDRRSEAFADGDLVTADAVQHSFEEGGTVQFFQPQRFVDALWRINGGLEAFFSNLVGASAYLTPPGSQGLAPHHDDVEVFILQTEGSKRWKLYDPVEHDLPSDYSQDLPRAAIGEPILEVELQQGDLLYMPRGVVHEASTPPGTFSTHITLSTYQHSSWSSFLEALMPVALERAFHTHRAFREGLPVCSPTFVGSLVEALPPSAAPPGAQQYKESFHERTKRLLAALVDGVHDSDIGIAMDRFAADFVANRLPPAPLEGASGGPEEPSKSEGSQAFTPDTRLRWKHADYMRVNMQPAGIEVTHSLHNDRKTHLGGGQESDSDSEDEEDSDAESGDGKGGNAASEDGDKGGDEDGGESEDEDGEEEGSEGEDAGLTFPHTLAPLFALLFQAAGSGDGFVSVADLSAACAAADDAEVHSTLALLVEEGLLGTA